MDELFFKGQRFISSKRASELTSYTKDYIGQLCRAEKIDARLVGRNWYVSESSILTHRKKGRSDELDDREKTHTDFINESPHYISGETLETPYYKQDSRPLIPNPNKKANVSEEQKIIANFYNSEAKQKPESQPQPQPQPQYRSAFSAKMQSRAMRDIVISKFEEPKKKQPGGLFSLLVPAGAILVCITVLTVLFSFEKLEHYEAGMIKNTQSSVILDNFPQFLKDSLLKLSRLDEIIMNK